MKTNTKHAVQLIFFFLYLYCQPSFAHQTSDSYFNIINSQQKSFISWSIAIRDLEYAVGLDIDANRKIRWQEILQRQSVIEAYIISRLSLYSMEGNQKKRCQIDADNLLVDDKADGSYLVFNITSPCLQELVAELSANSFTFSKNKTFYLDYQLLFDIDKNHRGLILIEIDGNVVTKIASPENHRFKLQNETATVATVLLRYITEGVWHILIGLDHILFLLVLLLPSVLVYKNEKWQHRESIRVCFISILKIVTAFTLAHSITLSLSVLKIVQFPSQLVEVAIAMTVLLTCLHILKPIFQQALWKLAFVFGLVHGFGFANVLLDLGLEDAALAWSLLGFNVGVEIGQLFIVLLFILFASVTHHHWWYRKIIFNGGISLTALISCVWIFERMFNYELLNGRLLGF